MKSETKVFVGMQKPPPSVNKPVPNVFSKTCNVFFCEKGKGNGSNKVPVCKIRLETSPVVKDSSRKRPTHDFTNADISQARPSKKPKFDVNMNTENVENCGTNSELCGYTVSAHKLKKNGMTLTRKDNAADFFTKISRISTNLMVKEDKALETGTKNGNFVEKQTNLEGSKSAAEKLISKKVQLQDKERDFGFNETFSILEEFSQDSSSEKQCPNLCTTPNLCSPASSSSELISSSNSRTCSPDQQSSITKYFSPIRAETFSSPPKNVQVSPSSDRTGKRNLRARKDAFPSSPVLSRKEQMYLDLGQKDFGHVTCPACNMVYTRAQPEDEADHMKFHRKFVTSLRFLGWKTERIVEQFDDGRVIVVLPQDHFTHQKKVADVRRVVDDELGFSAETFLRMNDAQTYMFIASKKVVGCVVVVDIQKAYRVLPCGTKDQDKLTEMQGAWCCSTTPVRAQCGISRVWVLQQYRRRRIATRLLDCVRKHFIFGCVITKETLAFSDPTPHGKRLAESYFGTESFLVFR